MDIPYNIMMPNVMLVVAERSTEPILFHVTNKYLIIVEIRLLRSIFLRPPERYLHWASNATLDRPVACQMTKLEQIKA